MPLRKKPAPFDYQGVTSVFDDLVEFTTPIEIRNARIHSPPGGDQCRRRSPRKFPVSERWAWDFPTTSAAWATLFRTARMNSVSIPGLTNPGATPETPTSGSADRRSYARYDHASSHRRYGRLGRGCGRPGNWNAVTTHHAIRALRPLKGSDWAHSLHRWIGRSKELRAVRSCVLPPTVR